MHGIRPEDYPSGTTNQHTSCKRGETPLGPEKEGLFQHFLSREKGFIRNRNPEGMGTGMEDFGGRPPSLPDRPNLASNYTWRMYGSLRRK